MKSVLALMRAHAAQGERAQAVRVYDRFAARLRNEMEAKPRGRDVRFL